VDAQACPCDQALHVAVAAGVFIALMLTLHDGPDIIEGGFDGCYTYFASEQVSWAAQPANWLTIARCARSILARVQGLVTAARVLGVRCWAQGAGVWGAHVTARCAGWPAKTRPWSLKCCYIVMLG
jgi:hypothetical protein